jgi:hypothetical protein
VILAALLHVFSTTKSSTGFELNTHAAISQRAVDASALNTFLAGVLSFDFPDGVGEVLKPGPFGRVRDLVAEVGSKNEDSPFSRTRHHFHDPTRTWDQAGLRWPLLGQIGESSVRWSQNPNQEVGGKHSWHDARQSYFDALTATNPADRKRLFAETFESLGHLIHHVQDAATPSHSRNDTHIGAFATQGYGFPIGNPDRFHHWANTTGLGQIGGNLPFAPSILTLSQNSLAPVPIARIIDATDGDRGTPQAGNDIGIAEYSNGNFFSDDTIFKDYAYPTVSSMELVQAPGPNTTALRFYLKKKFGPGETNNGNGYRAAVASRLSGFVPLGFGAQQWELDDNVMADYGALLFPRAVGYSAGLIDYFFRGVIAGDAGDLGCFFPNPPHHDLPQQLEIELGNFTPEEETGNGTLFLVVVSSVGSQKHFIISEPENLILMRGNQNDGTYTQTATFRFNQGLPQNATSPRFYLAYKGPLGEESESVIVGEVGYTGLC